MTRKWTIGVVIALVVAFGAGYRVGKGSRESQLIDARQAGEDFQRAWFEGVDKVQAEREEKFRVMQEEQDRERAEQKAQTDEAVAEINAQARRDFMKNPDYLEALSRLPESERQAFAEKYEAEMRRMYADEDARAYR